MRRLVVGGMTFRPPLRLCRFTASSPSSSSSSSSSSFSSFSSSSSSSAFAEKASRPGQHDRGGLFSILRRGPRSRAEFLGMCLGCAVFPVSVAIMNWYDNKKNESSSFSELAPDFQSMRSVAAAPKHQLGGPFRLRESKTGEYITDKELFSDHWTLLYFGFSKCAEVCPTTLRFIADVLQKCDKQINGDSAKEASRLQVVFLSIDSFRDTPEVLQKFVSQFDHRVRALCGNINEVRQAAQAWRVFYSSLEETDEEREAREAKGIPEIELDDNYQFDHSSAIYLVGPDGRMKDFFFKEMGMDDMISRLEVHFADVYGFKDTR